MVQSPPCQNVAVVLRIGEGSFTEGFAVELQILEDGCLIDKDSDFPRLGAAPEIPQCYQVWKPTYDALGRAIGSRAIQPVSAQVTHKSSLKTCLDMTKDFETKVKTWLSSSTFGMLRDRIQANVGVAADPSVPIILDCDTGDLEQDNLLRKLPWHTWDLFDRVNHAEVVLGARFARHTLPLQARVKTLAILGSDEGGLNLEEDIRALKELERNGSEIHIRLQPDREQLSKCLYHQSCDILFFAGHSFSDAGCQTGAIQLQNGVPLAIDDLREDLKQAIRNGLKLVIFNSCDGLGIARFIEQLSVAAKLRMPVMIVMREPVPDRVARKFLQYFLEEFSQGKPLYLAVRKARNRLHWLESDNKQPCPAATWLPIVCQNPNQPELVFPQLQPEPITSELQPDESQPKLESKTDQPPQLHPPDALKLLLIVGLVALGFPLVKVVPHVYNSIKDAIHTPVEPPIPTLPSPKIYNTLAEVPVPTVPTVPKNKVSFRYGGSTTWAPIRGSVDLAIEQTLPNFRLQYVNPPEGSIPSTGMGVEMLLNGEIDFAQASRLLNIKDIDNAQKKGMRLKAIPVAKSFKAIAVHPSLTLKNKGLTVHQIREICDGKITNWREVGGPDLPIQVFTRKTTDLIRTLGDKCRGKNAVSISTPQEVIQKLAETPGGFNVNTAPILVPQCSIKTLPVKNASGKFVAPYKEPLVSPTDCRVQPNQVHVEVFKSGEYPKELSDTLYVVVKEDGQIGQQAGEAYANLLLSNEGQKLLEAAGFVSIRQTR
ncbi:substrate-binding domain-containing protein [Allocoleopsis sp.]|uniref:substrate-binding domain-containing protein n=1 Tax=Allocoleopsis sp. TaxID=3088169 RepID=UPI002FD75E9C